MSRDHRTIHIRLTSVVIERLDHLLPVFEPVPISELGGKTFQVHVLPGQLKLVPVWIEDSCQQCVVVISRERCGLKVGHEGKHVWGSGD